MGKFSNSMAKLCRHWAISEPSQWVARHCANMVAQATLGSGNVIQIYKAKFASEPELVL